MATGRLEFTERELLDAFPTSIGSPREIQLYAIAEQANGKRLGELPTGSGKTALEFMDAKACFERLEDGEVVFWIFPTKALVLHAKKKHPSIRAILGKQDHVCVWAGEDFEEESDEPVTRVQLPILQSDKEVSRVSDIPQALCSQCPHFVDQQSGETQVKGVLPCTYFQETHEAKQGHSIIATTMSRYIFTKLFARRTSGDSVHQTAYGRVAGVVIDEVDRFADVIRYTLSYDITDRHLERAIALLKRIKAPEQKYLQKFLDALTGIAEAHKKEPYEKSLRVA